MRKTLALCFFAVAACQTTGSGKIVSDARTVDGFTRASFGGGLEVTVTEGALSELVITGDDNLVRLFTSRVEGGELIVERDPLQIVAPTKPLTATITVPSLEAFTASGGTKATVARLAASAVDAKASGGSTLTLAVASGSDRSTITASGGSVVTFQELTSPNVTFVASGGSTVEATGSGTTQLTLTVSGASVAKLAQLATDTLSINASGGSNVRATARQSATGSASGGSTVEVHGAPATQAIAASGGSTVTFPAR